MRDSSERSERRRRRPRLVRAAAVVSLLALGFVWGRGFVKHYWFPHSLIRKIEAWVQGKPVLFSIFAASGGVSYQRSASFDDISSLPYVGVAESGGNEGDSPTANILDPEKSYPGLNLFTMSNADKAFLSDMQGKIIWEWKLPREKVVWDSTIAQRQGFMGWRSVRADPRLNLIVIYDYLGIVKLDARSNPVWINRNGAHHSFFVTPGGEIYTLTSRLESLPEIHPRVPLITDSITVLGPAGRQRKEYSILDLLLSSGYGYLIPSVAHETPEYPIDLFHANTIEVLDGSGESVSPTIFKKGNVLLSLRNISTILIADLEEKAVRWIWGPSNIAYQHTPRMVPGPHVLLFDNGTSRSSVIEVDPIANRILWKFTGPQDAPLSSRIYGACQMLPNGNVLVTDSLQARAMETTKDGEIVWTFKAGAGDNKRLPALYEMRRYSPDYFRGR